MELLWLPIAVVALSLSGCTRKTEPYPPTSPTEAQKPLPTTAKPPVAETPPAKPQAERFAKPAEKKPANCSFDSFHLPLVIRIDLPEVPPEIRNPSPPIKENLEPPMKIDNPKIGNPSPPIKQESELP